MWRLSLISLFLFFSCKNAIETNLVEAPIFTYKDTVNINTMGFGYAKLSDFGFFSGFLRNLTPAENVFPYQLNSTLFSDYAEKDRFIFIPAGRKLIYIDNETFDYPDGTILIKNFYYGRGDRVRQIVETRLLKKESGNWIPLSYVWNESQNEAYFWPIGHNVSVSNDKVGESFQYSVPDLNQCKNCHMQDGYTKPVGPSPANWNLFAEKDSVNQLLLLSNVIEGMPHLSDVGKYVDYSDLDETIDARARAYLDMNCGSCHRSLGSAKTTGLDLSSRHNNLYALGIYKPPVAAGKGSGGRLYDVVPGKPEESILLYRMENNDPEVRMPEIGRKIVHEEGVALIRQWINDM